MKMNNNFFHSFFCAGKGIAFTIKTERNIRIHFVFIFYILLFAPFYKFNTTEKCIIALAISAVMVCEMLNTAIEKAIDLISPGYNKLAGTTKDISAGAVLLSAMFSAYIGIRLFFNKNIIKQIITFYFKNTALSILLYISFALSLIFIIYPSKKKEN